MTAIVTEREDKFDADADFELPSLAAIVPGGGSVEAAEVELVSCYFDTPELDLLGRGITVRRRRGDSDTGWHAKVPAKKARTEIRLPLGVGEDSVVPGELTDVLVGAALGKPLAPVATLTTVRRLYRVLTADGTLVAEVADDSVHAHVHGTGDDQRWREVEVEIGAAGSEKFLKKAGSLIVSAGAVASAESSKLGRVLAPSVQASDSVATEAVRSYLDEQFRAIVAGDVYLRRGLDPIHATRVAIRRYRSTLRVFGNLFDEDASSLESELAWYASLLGEVRDRQVQRARFAEALGALPAELVLGPVAARIENDLLSEQIRYRETVMTELDGERYRTLLDTLARWSRTLPLDGVDDRTLEKLARKAGKKADSRTTTAAKTGDDDELHRARKASKRARYAAELVEPVIGKKESKRLVKHYKGIQEVLGEHQDAVVAAEILKTLGIRAGTTPGENGFTFGLLYAQEVAAAHAARTEAATLK